MVEVIAVRRHPFEFPAHAFLVGLDLGKRRARDDDQRYIALCEMSHRAIEMISKQRAARAALHPAGTKHEVIDDELAFAAEEVGQRFLPLRPCECIVLFDLDPRQSAPRLAQLVACLGKFLFFREQRLARSQPFALRNDFMLHGMSPTMLLVVSSSRYRRRLVRSELQCDRHQAHRRLAASVWRRRTVPSSRARRHHRPPNRTSSFPVRRRIADWSAGKYRRHTGPPFWQPNRCRRALASRRNSSRQYRRRTSSPCRRRESSARSSRNVRATIRGAWVTPVTMRQDICRACPSRYSSRLDDGRALPRRRIAHA